MTLCPRSGGETVRRRTALNKEHLQRPHEYSTSLCAHVQRLSASCGVISIAFCVAAAAGNLRESGMLHVLYCTSMPLAAMVVAHVVDVWVDTLPAQVGACAWLCLVSTTKRSMRVIHTAPFNVVSGSVKPCDLRATYRARRSRRTCDHSPQDTVVEHTGYSSKT